MPLERIKIRILPDGRIARADAATYLGLTPKTLAEWSRLGRGPRPRRVGGRIFYMQCDLDAFVACGAREAS